MRATDTQPLYVTRPSLPPFEEYIEVIRPLWESGQLTNRGPLSITFEQRLRARLGVENVWLFSNGHMALELMLQGMDLPRGSEVLTTPYTHCSTTHAIVRAGFIPVMVDIEQNGCGIDPVLAEEAITERTSAILATHVYGFPCAVSSLERIAHDHKLKLLFDGAHAFDVRVGGHPIACFGDATMFSTHATKVFQTLEGGIVAWQDNDVLSNLSELVNFGLEGDGARLVAPNARMNEFEAAMGICNLDHLDEELGYRRRAFERYRDRLSDAVEITLLEPPMGVQWNYAYLPVRLRDRDRAEARLKQNDIFARRYFSPSVDLMECYKGWFEVSKFPFAHRLSQEILCLPLSASMKTSDVDRVCDVLLSSL